jgi:uncharacterized ion transporter superfamily protein YfcC
MSTFSGWADMKTTKIGKPEVQKPQIAKSKGDINPFVLIGVLLLLAVLATWFVDAGQFDRVLDPVTKTQIAVAGSFHLVTPHPVGFWEAFQLIQKGYTQASVVIFFLLVVGGMFAILSKTGCIDAF